MSVLLDVGWPDSLHNDTLELVKKLYTPLMINFNSHEFGSLLLCCHKHTQIKACQGIQP